jgi:hypothetical protein
MSAVSLLNHRDDSECRADTELRCSTDSISWWAVR